MGVFQPSKDWHRLSTNSPLFPLLPLQSLIGNSCYFIMLQQPVIYHLPTILPVTFKQHMLKVQGVKRILGYNNMK